MRFLIALLVVIFGLLKVLNDGLATFTAPAVPDLPVASVPVSVPQPVAIVPEQGALVPGRVSVAERYQLALAAGWSPAEAIIATAIAMAENGAGDPRALSPKNWDGSRDLGLWQINSGWWSQFGGQEALSVPLTNALAAHAIFLRQGWCAWSTYGTPATCYGIAGHNNSYSGFLACAQRIAQGGAC